MPVVNIVSGGGTSTLTVGNNNASSTFAGTIKNTSGTLSLVKTGSGALLLSGNNTYAGGTTVAAGGLLLGGGSLSGSSAVSVSAAATFGGRGTAGTVGVAPGGIVQGGYNGAGTLNLSALTFNGNSTINLTPFSSAVPGIAVAVR